MASTDALKTEPVRAIGIVALVLGLVGLVAYPTWWLAGPLGITGLALGLLVRRRGSTALGMAAVAVGCCALVVAIVVAVALTPAGVAAG